MFENTFLFWWISIQCLLKLDTPLYKYQSFVMYNNQFKTNHLKTFLMCRMSGSVQL